MTRIGVLRDRLRTVGWIKRAAITLAVLCGIEIVLALSAQALIVDAPPEAADVAFVLSGAPEYVDRIAHAASLAQARLVPKILLTNDGTRSLWSRKQQRNLMMVERGAAALEAAGVRADQIEVLDSIVRSTADEGRILAAYLARHPGIRSVMVVTSAYHTRRALWTMRHIAGGGGQRIKISGAPYGPETPGRWTWWLRARGWSIVAGEYLKFAYYLAFE